MQLSAAEYWRRVLRLWCYPGAVRAVMTAWAQDRAPTPNATPQAGSGRMGAAEVPAEAMNTLTPPAPGTTAPLITFSEG